jgi:hypothetical protein
MSRAISDRFHNVRWKLPAILVLAVAGSAGASSPEDDRLSLTTAANGAAAQPVLALPDPIQVMRTEWRSAEAGRSRSAQYLATDLPGPEIGAPEKGYDRDVPANLNRAAPLMPPPHPLARSGTKDLCPEPPLHTWQRWLREGTAYADHAQAEPLDGRRAYLPFKCDR